MVGFRGRGGGRLAGNRCEGLEEGSMRKRVEKGGKWGKENVEKVRYEG